MKLIEKYCQKSSLELLAPAGEMNSLEAVVEAGCDAVYLGGKSFNMRMLRSSLNFSNEELLIARRYTRDNGVKMYVTVNNLYTDENLSLLEEYLLYLQDIGVDALIVQDIALVALHQKLNLRVPLHASVQMGINNLESARYLEDAGFERVILSKNLSLKEISHIFNNSGIGLEYFVHGDVCVSHTGQCYMSSFIFGESGNRGRCRKPCRWPYTLAGANVQDPDVPMYYLAHNDLCLYDELELLVNAGISSFKVEGRMRTPEFVGKLVSVYRHGLDRIIQDAGSKDAYHDDDWKVLNDIKIREFTKGGLDGLPDPHALGLDGSREPVFFSKAPAISCLSRDISLAREVMPKADLILGARVKGLEQVESAVNGGASNIYIGYPGTGILKNPGYRKDLSAAAALCGKRQASLIMEMPRIAQSFEYESLDQDSIVGAGINGIMVHDMGMFRFFRQWPVNLLGGYGLNISNRFAADYWIKQGLGGFDASLELRLDEMDFAECGHAEMIVHGALCGLIADVPWPGEERGIHKLSEDLYMIDEKDQRYRVTADLYGRKCVYYPYDLCLLPVLPDLAAKGFRSVRIAGDFYESDLIFEVCSIYREALQQLSEGVWSTAALYQRLWDLFGGRLSMASFDHIDSQDT